MSESSDLSRIAVLAAQFAEVYRRVEEIRSDVRIEQAQTRQEMQAGFARMDGRYNGLDERVRAVEGGLGTQKERLSTWNRVLPLLSAVAGGLGAWSKDLISLFLK